MPAAAREIRPLPDLLINQIAAGEVIERPASVVKELVENALDAGARTVAVEIEEGGLRSIVVTDDGHGIPRAQIHAALARHCTSKIAASGDLDAIASLGFRGEALASIGAVADVEIVTRTEAEPHAWRVTAAAGRAPEAPQPCRGPVGTRLAVRDLFHSVPARRRFLKRPRTEFLHVQRLVRRIAFATPHVALSLSQPGARGLTLPPATGATAPRWAALFGAPFVRAAVPVDAEADGVRVHGWVGGPDLAASQSELQYLALNGRHIRDRSLVHAVRVAYGDSIPAGRFPAYALAVEMAPDAVDVNVHPGKLEVRFAAPRAVHDLVHAVVARALAGVSDTRIPDASAPPPPVPAAERAARRGSRWQGGTPGRAAGRVRDAPPSPFPEPVALVGDRFLVYGGEPLAAVDLRALWRTVLAARFAAAGAPASRPLIFPERLSGDAALVAARDALARVGVVVEDDASPRLTAVPALLPELNTPRFVAQLEAALLAGRDATAAVVEAASDAATLDSAGRPSADGLAALARAARAADVDVRAHALILDADVLDGLLGGRP